MSAGGYSYGPGDDWTRVYGARPGGLTARLFNPETTRQIAIHAYNDPAGYDDAYTQVVNTMADPDSAFAAWLSKQFNLLQSQYQGANDRPGNENLTWTDFLSGNAPANVPGETTPATQPNARQTLTERYLALPGWQQGKQNAGTAFTGPYLTKYGGG